VSWRIKPISNLTAQQAGCNKSQAISLLNKHLLLKEENGELQKKPH
jgi:hypothetical protein